jgi:DNA replication and repair protein RecF
VKGYASQGESWSVALSLKLASYLFLRNEGINPILILDDVFSELDEARREQLVDLANTNEQTLITVAVDGDVPRGITGGRVHIKNGALL